MAHLLIARSSNRAPAIRVHPICWQSRNLYLCTQAFVNILLYTRPYLFSTTPPRVRDPDTRRSASCPSCFALAIEGALASGLIPTATTHELEFVTGGHSGAPLYRESARDPSITDISYGSLFVVYSALRLAIKYSN